MSNNLYIINILQNYFPMVRTAYIEDDLSRLVLVSDRAHGVSSQANGQLEVMLHRRLWNNLAWNLGYNLTLNDSSVVRPTLWMMLGSVGATSKLYQREAIELQHRPVIMPIDQPRECLFFKAAQHKTLFDLGSFLFVNQAAQSLLPLERPWQEKEPRRSSPVRSVVLPPNLHLLSLSVPGWNYSSNHDVHLSHIHSGQL